MASAVMYAIRTISGNQPQIARTIEKATQTFLLGVPVQVDQSVGAIKEWDGTTVAAGISGISKEAASNLTTTGVAKTLTFGSVQNETLAVNIPRGAPLNDGKIGYETSVFDSVFYGQVGPSQTTAATDVTKQYGMTKDSDNHWYVDKTNTSTPVVVVLELDTIDTTRGVHFAFLPSASQILG